MQKNAKIVTALVAVGVGTGAVFAFWPKARPAPAAPATVAAALTVQAVTSTVETWPIEVQASGWLAPWAEAVVASQVGGEKVIAVHVEIGDHVKTGDLLAELSRATIENRLAELQAGLDSAASALGTATQDANRVRQLAGGGAVSEQQTASYLATERQAKAAVTMAEAQLAAEKLALANTRIVAISDGMVSGVSTALGQVVTQGQEMFRLIRDNRIEWRAEVPLIQLRGIDVGTRVVIPTPFGEIGGTVRRMSPAASQTNGRVIAYVDLEPPPGVPMPKTGILVTGAFVLQQTEAVALPATAISLQDGFSYVFVIEGETVRRQKVDPGRRRGEAVEILGDFARDAQVVKSGGAFLSDGSVVRVVGALP
jgi:RND family efflux transporter MFP subunit